MRLNMTDLIGVLCGMSFAGRSVPITTIECILTGKSRLSLTDYDNLRAHLIAQLPFLSDVAWKVS